MRSEYEDAVVIGRDRNQALRWALSAVQVAAALFSLICVPCRLFGCSIIPAFSLGGVRVLVIPVIVSRAGNVPLRGVAMASFPGHRFRFSFWHRCLGLSDSVPLSEGVGRELP